MNARRSISDMSSLRSSNQNVPKTIKRYVPGANGLVAIEVPNPNHPDNQPKQQQRPQSSSSLRSTVGRSTSLTASPTANRQISLTKPSNSPSLSGRRSITKSESKILANGTKVETIVTEVYVPENDNYENFDSSEIHDLNQIDEEGPGDDYVDLERERVQEETTKKLIHENEEIEMIQRERAFSSFDQPMEETVVINDKTGIDDSQILDDDLHDELFTPEERKLAEEKLNELVELKEREILDEMIKRNQLEMSRGSDDSIKTEDSFELNDESEHISTSELPPVTQSDNLTDSLVSDDIKQSISSHSSTTDQNATTPFKSMAQHMRNSIQQTKLNDYPAPVSESLKLPNRSPESQAQIHQIEQMTPTKSNNNDTDLDDVKILSEKHFTNNQDTLVKRKSVLKNKNQSKNYDINANVNYSSLTTAENTRLNAMASSSTLNLARPRRESFNGGQNDSIISNSMTAASKAATRYSAQPGSFESPPKQSQQQRPNPKVEEAKKKILAGSPAQKKAKEIYRLSKSRPTVTESYLQELANDDFSPRKSSFEKTVRPELEEPRTSKSSKRMTLRDENDLNPRLSQIQPNGQQPNQPQHFSQPQNLAPATSNSKLNKSNFKSRFSNDSDSDYDIPIMTKNSTTHYQLSQPQPQSPQQHPHQQVMHTNIAQVQNDVKTPRKKSESKFQKFFTEPANKRHTSTATQATSGTSGTVEKSEKKGGFRKLKKLFGSKK